jgi:hypothetical protein
VCFCIFFFCGVPGRKGTEGFANIWQMTVNQKGLIHMCRTCCNHSWFSLFHRSVVNITREATLKRLKISWSTSTGTWKTHIKGSPYRVLFRIMLTAPTVPRDNSPPIICFSTKLTTDVTSLPPRNSPVTWLLLHQSARFFSTHQSLDSSSTNRQNSTQLAFHLTQPLLLISRILSSTFRQLLLLHQSLCS